MCSIAAVGVASMGMQLVGGYMQYAGGMREADSIKAKYDYDAAVMENNAIAMRNSADVASRPSIAKQGDIIRAGQIQAGRGRAQFGAGNVAVGQGSAGQFESGVQAGVEEDVARTQYGEALERWGYETRAQEYRAQAGMLRATGIQAKFERRSEARGALMGGVMNAGLSGLSLYTAGAFGSGASSAASSSAGIGSGSLLSSGGSGLAYGSGYGMGPDRAGYGMRIGG